MERTAELLSVCIVSYQTRQFLHRCLATIYEHPPARPFEVIVVDNGSTDGTPELVRNAFPRARLICNNHNLGYTAAMNQALREAQGEYLVQLNPDTEVYEGAFDLLADFLEAHPDVGICGPKVLNPDGTLQRSCRRGESTPLAVIAHFSGLDRLFPNNPRLAQYWMSYRGEDEIHEVAGVSGSCMMIRRAVVDQIGYLDERFFAYQEDADYCFRARQAGWKVMYVPTAKVLHYGGVGGSHVQPYRSILEWHRSYWNYYRKNLARHYPPWFNGLYYLMMAVKLASSLLLQALHLGRFSRRNLRRSR
ncbi:MAG: glycosyltransferase family 2 protein [Anaerolineales bacterium]|nr:glycosyltransferase family 2 protein [Anaerolineales bacterium]MDW8446331.1 glycosyltransferase family 2 protein [Anaerolineales bacterium]